MFLFKNIQFRQKGLYFALLGVSSLLVIVALGPGVSPEKLSFGQTWQYHFFHFVCHQDPIRSYSINNFPMAVCSRCFGIYTSFVTIVFLMPILTSLFIVTNKLVLKLIVIAISLNFLDVLGNYLGIWTNTLHSRLLLGTLFGGFLALFLTNEFFKQKNKMENNYG